MDIRFTKHARERMTSRGISEDDVIHALRHPRISYPTRRDSVCFEGADVGGRTIRVWCPTHEAGPDRYTIKSTARKG